MTTTQSVTSASAARAARYLGSGAEPHATSRPAAPTSGLRFPDGATHRIEIPSVEGPACVGAVIEAARRWEVPVVRLSQGSGTSMLTDGEVREMGAMAAEAGIELSLFLRPCAGWDTGATSRAPAGAAFAAS